MCWVEREFLCTCALVDSEIMGTMLKRDDDDDDGV